MRSMHRGEILALNCDEDGDLERAFATLHCKRTIMILSLYSLSFPISSGLHSESKTVWPVAPPSRAASETQIRLESRGPPNLKFEGVWGQRDLGCGPLGYGAKSEIAEVYTVCMFGHGFGSGREPQGLKVPPHAVGRAGSSMRGQNGERRSIER
jgi:hypothetical protein